MGQSCDRQLRWTAVKLFTVPPAFIAAIAICFVISVSTLLKAAPFIIQTLSGLIGVGTCSYLCSPVFAPICRRAIITGCAFGVLVCSAGGLTFGLVGGLVYPEWSIAESVTRSFGYFAFYGFPVAAITGLLFSGAAQRAHGEVRSDKKNSDP